MFFSSIFKREKSKPISKVTPCFNLQLDITYNCNLHCNHCYQKTNFKNNDELKLDDWKKIIREYAQLTSQLGTNAALTLSGGEPLTSPSIKDLIKFIKYNYPNTHIYILTNGTLLNNDIAGLLKETNSKVQISLDGPNEILHDSLRGNGSFRKVMGGGKILKEANVPFTFQAVIQRRIQHVIRDFFEIAKKCEANAMDFTRLIPSNRQSQGEISEMLKCEELKIAFENILSASKFYNIETNTFQPLWCLIDSNLGHPSSAGFLGFTIAPTGEIQLTSRVNEYIGNAKEEGGLSKTYFDNILLKKLRLGKIRGCSKCEHFKKCRGDRNISYIIGGDFLGPDVHCWYWKNYLNNYE